MAKKTDLKEKLIEIMKHKEKIRNIGIVAHIDHGKTTMSDSLVAAAGMLSESIAGDARWLDSDQEEQDRGITINSGNVSMVHEIGGEEFVINLVDTPGHVDFGGEVTRAMRAVDGALVLLDAVEGAMPQTETVLRQALKERVKPVLFINKVDRLIKELQLTPQEMSERFSKMIANVNKLIKRYAPEEYKEKWQVSVQNGSVGFGSAIDRWATNVDTMKSEGIGFKQILDFYSEKQVEELTEKAPLHKTLLDMVIKYLPTPLEAQKYRVARIWRGSLDTVEGKAMQACDDKGPLMGVITKIVNDPHAGEVANVRFFSGSVKAGQEIALVGAGTMERTQQVALYKGPFRVAVPEVTAGNIAAIVGLKSARAGETVAFSLDADPFEEIKHIFEPVVTKALEAQNPKDLPKLVEVLVKMSKEDPTLKVDVNQETGEILISGMGELHLEIKEKFILRDWKVPVRTSPPIVVYRETVSKRSGPYEGKSPNKHNKLFISVEPLETAVLDKIVAGDIPEGVLRKGKDDKVRQEFISLGMTKTEVRRIIAVKGNNILVNATKGIVHFNEIQESILQGFYDIVDHGPLAFEKCSGIKFLVEDAKLHEDSIHRGPAQIIPAVRDGVKGSMAGSDARLLEPIQTIQIDVPMEHMGSVTTLVQGRRGKVLEVQQNEGEHVAIIVDIPVAKMFGFTSNLRSATTGMGHWSLINSRFEPLPKELQNDTVLSIRRRKGMKEVIFGED
ncbi:MAG: elongation factor EF-2 [Candidatus Altiarchaeota archaeon]|nr:elongation factor EF-2 [Candidatus Altiarchaeota archaeon]